MRRHVTKRAVLPSRVLLVLASLVATLLTACGAGDAVGAPEGKAPLEAIYPDIWPPAVGMPYPDLDLLDQDGNAVRLSEMAAGKVLLVEPFGMSCPACQAFSGGNEIGGFERVTPQPGVWSVETLLDRYADGIEVGDPDLVFVQLLLYDRDLGAPTPADAARWDRHFGITELGGHVLVPDGDLRRKSTYDLVPGFQLVDRDFVLRKDASGHRPQHSMSTELFPLLAELLRGRP